MKSVLAIAVLARVLVAWRTHVPARDAEAYLWMAERIAEGEFGAAFQTVFHPLYPLLTACGIACGLPAVGAGQLVACGCGALAVLPLYAATRRLFDERAALFAGLFYALGIWFVRHPADCLSEGPFFLVVASALWVVSRAGARGRGLILGALSGLAYGLRPEGLAIVIVGAPWCWLRGERREVVSAIVACLLIAAPWPVGWAIAGDGFTWTPKAAFNYEQGIGGVGGGNAIAHYLDHAWRVPGAAFEAIGYVALPLAVVGVVRARPIRLRDPAAWMLATFLLQCAVIPALRSNIRFLAGYGILLLPFAGIGAARIASWARERPVALRVALLAAAFGPDFARLPQSRRAARIVLVELGAFLEPRLDDTHRLATEMPRLAYFAGQKPGPPRPIPRDEILRQAEAPTTHVVAVVEPRTHVSIEDLRSLGFAPMELPDRLRQLVTDRGMLVAIRTD